MGIRSYVIEKLECILAKLKQNDPHKFPNAGAGACDYMPLYFWDNSLSSTAKIIMSLMSGGETGRESTFEKLRAIFPNVAVESIKEAILELEEYGYLFSESYRGQYGEPRIDQRLCVCPQTRLPRISEPKGRKLSMQKTAEKMYARAVDLGFVAETGKDTTYLLYDAMRIFTAVESQLTFNEYSLLPIIGPETVRVGLSDSSALWEYPHCMIGIILTTSRVIFCQEDQSPEGRKAGYARFISKDFCEIKSVAMNETVGRVTFTCEGSDWDSVFSVDIITPFGVDIFERSYDEAIALLALTNRPPKMERYTEKY